MSDDVNKNAGMRGLALQCPWSICFPQLYNNRQRTPCAQTPFASFRLMIDHIWKYHSSILSCDKCNYRFPGAKRGEKDRPTLVRLKNEHNKECHSDKSKDVPRNLRDSIRTMTDEQDEILRKFKAQDRENEETMEPNYKLLCSSLFGNDVEVPANLKYHYLIAEHTINPESARLGARNEEYVMQRRVAAQNGSTAGFHQQLSPNSYQYPKNPLLLDELDEPPPLSNWTILKPTPDLDSGYGSKPSAEAGPQADNSTGINTGWDYESGWRQSNDNFGYASGGDTTFFDQTLNYRRSSVDLEIGDMNWELDNSDGPLS
ncbi:hypothetical protein F4782DRAFT_525017 [Xylaria castorea]|nr:hypothetical protein F4782DRAFT_525017 [Xylaria castorea]